jgi:hypothetical protein
VACGIPLSRPVGDSEGLFRPGEDFLSRATDEMTRHLRARRDEPALAPMRSRGGLGTIRARHTCATVRRLLAILAELRPLATMESAS